MSCIPNVALAGPAAATLMSGGAAASPLGETVAGPIFLASAAASGVLLVAAAGVAAALPVARALAGRAGGAA